MRTLSTRIRSCQQDMNKNPYPAALEAVLRTEEAVSAGLQAGRALQGPRVVGAFDANALARGNGRSHGGQTAMKELKIDRNVS